MASHQTNVKKTKSPANDEPQHGAKRTAPEFATQRELLYRLSPERVAVACVAIAVTPEEDAPKTDDKQAERSTASDDTKSTAQATKKGPSEPAPKKWQRDTAADLLRRLRVAAGFKEGRDGEVLQRAWSAEVASEASAPTSQPSSRMRDFSLHAFVMHYDATPPEYPKSSEAVDPNSQAAELIVDANSRATGRVRPAGCDALFPLRLDTVPTAAAGMPPDSRALEEIIGDPPDTESGKQCSSEHQHDKRR